MGGSGHKACLVDATALEHAVRVTTLEREMREAQEIISPG